MIHDMLNFTKALEKLLSSSTPLMERLKPQFTLVGSVAEGTRIGLGTELDITLKFLAWETVPVLKVGSSAFHLIRNEAGTQEWMEKYFTEQGHFHFGRFMRDLLDAVESTVGLMFDEAANPSPPRLRRVTANSSWNCRECSEKKLRKDRLFRQCKRCCVAVSQTKIGVCLQLQWSEEDQAGKSIALNLFRHLIGFLHCTHSLFYKGHFYKGHCLILGKIKGQSILLAHKIRDKTIHGEIRDIVK